MSLKNRVKNIDLEFILINKVNELKRYTLVWEWMEEHQLGNYIKYADLVRLIQDGFSGISVDKIKWDETKNGKKRKDV
ncbi:hypothetical protein LCGC14_1972330 [marine sediment metagenome]|uniref:Uncharacterized protein n=1 Tax=marine sediment metagenome TaxID=412755 RepID=A0A0F9FBT5_9ZZZZ